MITYSLKVERLQQETNDTVTIFFKQPALKKVKYLAGQYLPLIFRINGRRYIRPYSFSSAPGVDTTLNVTVKRVDRGIVSNHIIDKVNVGDIIEVLAPMGNFVLDRIQSERKSKHLVLWGSGSGITPLISLVKFALYNDIFAHVTLVYGNRNFESTIFSDQINEICTKYTNQFSAWHFHTQAVIDETNPYVIQGRIDPSKVFEIMHNNDDTNNSIHYICGSTGLKGSVKAQLAKLKISESNIFLEDFEVTRDPKEFEDIFTRNVAITLDGQSTLFEVVKGKSILEAGLDAMLELPYSCQTGSCLLCKATLTGGKIKTIGIAELPTELHDNEYLLCCSFPLTDNVEVLINN